LSYDVLPPPGGAGPVDVFDQTAVGEALARLDGSGGAPLAPALRFARAAADLDRRVPEQADLAVEMDAKRDSADPTELDLLAYRAERFSMHARVLARLPALERGAVDARRAKEPGTRVFSVGIGGVDLGMKAALGRAQRAAAPLVIAGRRGGAQA